ncbi:unnamed protein product [Lota lota]
MCISSETNQPIRIKQSESNLLIFVALEDISHTRTHTRTHTHRHTHTHTHTRTHTHTHAHVHCGRQGLSGPFSSEMVLSLYLDRFAMATQDFYAVQMCKICIL